MYLKILFTLAVTLALTACSQLDNESEPFENPEVTSSALLTEGCTGFFNTGNNNTRSDNIATFRQLTKIDSSYFELLRAAVELDLILGAKSLEEIKSLNNEYKSKVFNAITTFQTYCG